MLEAVAVALGLLYLVLAIREQRSGWVAGGLASLLFLLLFWRASLPMQALLQVYYVLVSIHGFLHWGPKRATAAP
ncbi:MAG: nicotinamide mononucleotide transporter, partial [Pseudomonadota bacterium]